MTEKKQASATAEKSQMTLEEQTRFLKDSGLDSMDASSMNHYIAEQAKAAGIDPGPVPPDVNFNAAMSRIDEKIAKGEDLEPVDKKVEEKKTEEKKEPEEQVTFEQRVEVAPGKFIVVEADTEEECRRKADLAAKAAEAAQPAKPAETKVELPVVDAGKLAELGRKLQEGKVEAIGEYLEANPAVFEKLIGAPISTLKGMLQEKMQNNEVKPWQEATSQFVQSHPEYDPTERNKLLMQYKIVEIKSANPAIEPLEAINQAYQALAEKKMIDVKTAEPVVTETKTETKPVVSEPVKKKATSSMIVGSDGGQHTKPAPTATGGKGKLITEEDFKKAKDPNELYSLAEAYNRQQSGMVN
jgi:hypothetical protein